MGDKSKIAWTDATWNFLYGCRKRGPECDNCYAMNDVYRLAGNPNEKVSAGKGDLVQVVNGRPQWTGKLQVNWDRMNLPLGWRRPRMIFVNSLSDVGYGGWAGDMDGQAVPWDAFAAMMRIMYLANWHIYQVLTKRPEFVASLLIRYYAENPEALDDDGGGPAAFYRRHFPHVWWGFSAGTRATLTRDIRSLAGHPGAVRWISVEPMLERLNLRDLFLGEAGFAGEPPTYYGELVDWVVLGGESQQRARPTEVWWVEEAIDACRFFPGAAAARDTQFGHEAPLREYRPIPVFVKQLGEVWARTHRSDAIGVAGPRYSPNWTAAQYGDKKGTDPKHWPASIRYRQWPAGTEEWMAGAAPWRKN